MLPQPTDFRDHLSTTAFSFRGYNVTNLGRTPELLARPDYATVVEEALREGSTICSKVLGRNVDLVSRVRQQIETPNLSTYAEDVALIVSTELAQLRLLELHFDIPLRRAKLAFGYSLGEVTALMAAGMYK